MHTRYSDGTGSVADLVRAAQAAGLRWIILTDHDTLAGLPEAGWYGDLLLIVGYEITPDRNHFLALNLPEVIPNTLPPQAFVDQVYAHGGFGIIAHPDERVQNSFKDIYRWDDWSVDGPQPRGNQTVGIELWNLMSDWGEHLTNRNKELLFFFPRCGLSGPTAETMDWWDRLNMAGKRTFGVGGVDVHAFKRRVPWGEVEVFPYQWCFETLTNYLWLGQPLSSDAPQATQQIYQALAAGQGYFLNRLDGHCTDLPFSATRATEQFLPGMSPNLSAGPLTLHASVAIDAELQIIQNGRVLIRGLRQLHTTIDTPGIYRLEGYRRGRPWLYSNPIYVVE
jgi:hypothetical protein